MLLERQCTWMDNFSKIVAIIYDYMSLLHLTALQYFVNTMFFITNSLVLCQNTTQEITYAKVFFIVRCNYCDKVLK